MKKPKVYYVSGTVVAIKGCHIFKDAICGYSSDIDNLRKTADVIELPVGDNGLYYLNNEGANEDYGECYLLASAGVTACGMAGQEGSIGAILSPIRAFEDYKQGIRAIEDLMELPINAELSRSMLRLLFVGVCGEMEGYLASTLIALVQGVRDVLIQLSELKGIPKRKDYECEQEWRENVVQAINSFQFQSIRSRNSIERKAYEMLLGNNLTITSGLYHDIEWRNKLAHRVVFHNEPIYPEKKDVIGFISETDKLVNQIDAAISQYKNHWIDFVSIQ